MRGTTLTRRPSAASDIGVSCQLSGKHFPKSRPENQENQGRYTVYARPKNRAASPVSMRLTTKAGFIRATGSLFRSRFYPMYSAANFWTD
jgi:hypothetical protein